MNLAKFVRADVLFTLYLSSPTPLCIKNKINKRLIEVLRILACCFHETLQFNYASLVLHLDCNFLGTSQNSSRKLLR